MAPLNDKMLNRLAMAAWALFFLSMVLPAYSGEFRGLACAHFVFIQLVEWTANLPNLPPRDPHLLYYLLFNASNALMLVLPPLFVLGWMRPVPKVVFIVQSILLLHVGSWPVYSYYDEGANMIDVGFWAWWTSMILMWFVVLKEPGIPDTDEEEPAEGAQSA